MKIYEYRKHLIGGIIRDPEFITNGGHWYDSNTDTYISVMEDKLPYYVPDTLTLLTLEQLIDRVQNFHKINPYKKRNGIMGSGGELLDDDMTEDDVSQMVIDWIDNQKI